MIQRLDDHQDQAGAWDVLGSVSGGLAFDIGANIGQAAAVLAKGFRLVVSVEPCLESFDILKAEAAKNVNALCVAASSFTGALRLTESARSILTGQLTTGAGLHWGDTVGTRVVQAVTVDRLVEEYGQPDFVKIDTEGHEVEVLEGWTGPRCAALIEVHRAEHEHKVRQLFGAPLRKLEHDPRRVGPGLRAEHFWLTTEGA